MTEMPKTEPIISEPIIMQITAATPTPPRFLRGPRGGGDDWKSLCGASLLLGGV